MVNILRFLYGLALTRDVRGLKNIYVFGHARVNRVQSATGRKKKAPAIGRIFMITRPFLFDSLLFGCVILFSTGDIHLDLPNLDEMIAKRPAR